jgi:anti-sigma regulatory factor (Ser/Thr protein kinase)
MNDEEIHVPISTDADLVTARAEARALAVRLGFLRPDPTLIATAISELARNIVMHVGHGEITMRPLLEEFRFGVLVVVRDEGPGIPDVDAALQDGYASRGGLGLGLPGARRLMDEFEIESAPGQGTTVRMKKWRVRDELELLRERRNGHRSEGGKSP